MVRSGLPALVITVFAFAAPVAAQPTAPENGGDGRYTFHRAGDGYMRLDGKTGQVSLCQRRSSGWQCQTVPDERSALEAEIARLQSDNAALKKELLSRNLLLPKNIRPDLPPVADAQPAEPSRLTGFARIMREIDKVWRRLVDMVASVQRDIMQRI